MLVIVRILPTSTPHTTTDGGDHLDPPDAGAGAILDWMRALAATQPS